MCMAFRQDGEPCGIKALTQQKFRKLPCFLRGSFLSGRKESPDSTQFMHCKKSLNML